MRAWTLLAAGVGFVCLTADEGHAIVAAAPQIRGHFFRGAGSPPSSDCFHSSYHTPICGFVVGFAQKLKGLRPRRHSDCHTRTNSETGGGVLWGGKCGALNMCAQELRPLSKGKSSRAWGYETKDHDSWALLLRHHANVAWHGVRSEYRLDNPVVLRNHHGRPGKRLRVFNADSHGTLLSNLRPVRSAGNVGGTGWGDCTWEEEEEYQLRHLRAEGSPRPIIEPPPATLSVHEMQGSHVGGIICVEEGYCRSWLGPSKFGGPTLSVEFGFRFGDWRARTEIKYHRASLVSAVPPFYRSLSYF
jgi:hypothetical protein